MICFDKGIFTSGQFKKVFLNGNLCNINEAEYPEVWAEVEAYLLDHPGALVPEPVPPVPTQEEKELQARSYRDSLIKQSDWMVLPDAPVDYTKATKYRQALREWPSTKGFPDLVTIPLME